MCRWQCCCDFFELVDVFSISPLASFTLKDRVDIGGLDFVSFSERYELYRVLLWSIWHYSCYLKHQLNKQSSFTWARTAVTVLSNNTISLKCFKWINTTNYSIGISNWGKTKLIFWPDYLWMKRKKKQGKPTSGGEQGRPRAQEVCNEVHICQNAVKHIFR